MAVEGLQNHQVAEEVAEVEHHQRKALVGVEEEVQQMTAEAERIACLKEVMAVELARHLLEMVEGEVRDLVMAVVEGTGLGHLDWEVGVGLDREMEAEGALRTVSVRKMEEALGNPD